MRPHIRILSQWSNSCLTQCLGNNFETEASEATSYSELEVVMLYFLSLYNRVICYTLNKSVVFL